MAPQRRRYPAAGLTVDGDGVKTVTCTAWNNAVDPQGNHNSGTNSVSVHIDEAPPVVSLEPVNPNDPTALVADTSDSESGVAGGSIEMAPAGTGSWTSSANDVHRRANCWRISTTPVWTARTRSRSPPATTSETAPQPTRTVMLPARVSRDLPRSASRRLPTRALQPGAGQDRRDDRRVYEPLRRVSSTVLQRGQSLLRVARDDTFRSAPTPTRQRRSWRGTSSPAGLRRGRPAGAVTPRPARRKRGADESEAPRCGRAQPELQSLCAARSRPRRASAMANP